VSLTITLIGMVLYLYKLGDQLFELLSIKFPKYYAKVKSPYYYTANMARNFRPQNYLTDLLIKGTPRDFPKSKAAQILAEKVRSFCLKWLILFFTNFAVIVIFAISFNH
jgi:hypothetical protein